MALLHRADDRLEPQTPTAPPHPALQQYQKKREFAETPEPTGTVKKPGGTTEDRLFVVQRHDASHLHYDFRLELDGVLKSWAVPKGPSTDPGTKRLAVHVEDHPLEYATFEGEIPAGQYGAGTVERWDFGTWRPLGDAVADYTNGRLKFHLEGSKLHGDWMLVRMGGANQEGKDGKNWLLIKERDGFAGTGGVHARGATRESRGAPAARGELPDTPFQLGRLHTEVPRGDGWIFEIKLDGYRAMARLNQGSARLITRGGQDWTSKFGRVAAALAALPARSAVIDGELVVLDRHGVSNFGALADAIGGGDDRDIVYFGFDLLWLDGEDLRLEPLLDRKARLARLLAGAPAPVRYLDHVVGHGEAFLRHSCTLGLEGVMAKKADGEYRSRRTDNWRKVKCLQRQEFVVVGWTEPANRRTGFGALLVATRKDGALVYAGRVGSGFNEQTLGSLHVRLNGLARPNPPLEHPPSGPEVKRMHWVEPELVAEIGFAEWTAAGRLRHPTFKGLREDKPAKEIVMEQASTPRFSKPKDRNTVGSGAAQAVPAAVSHADRVIDTQSGLTKGGLAEWYSEAAERLLPGIAGRALSVVRCPSGVSGACFFQKHLGEGFPAAIHTVTVPEAAGPAEYITVDDVAGLVALVQMGVIEIHPWGARSDRPDRPDRLILDLDPDPALPWTALVEGALAIRAQLAAAGLVSFVRTTGGKGLHVVAPIERTVDWDVLKAFTKAVADAVVASAPDRYTATVTKSKRVGRIFIDYLRNGRGATAIASWSVRARPGASVAVPVTWEGLPGLGSGDVFSVAEARRRLAGPDAWAGFEGVRQRLRAPG